MDFNIQLPDVTGSTVAGGIMGDGAVEQLQKALTAGYGTDVSTLQGGSALRIQSLDKTMKATIQDHSHFALFNELAKSGATATVDEWTERPDIGGFLGGSTNTETGNISQAQGNYKRRVGQVKYLMTRAEVSLVVTLGNNLASAKAVEAQNAALRLLSDAEFLCFEGDASVVPTEFDGLMAQMQAGVTAGDVDSANIANADGASLASINLINTVSAQVAKFGNFGRPTHLFFSLLTQADFDNGLDPAFRVALTDVPNGGISLGAPVVGIRTSHGNIKTVNDVFIRDDTMLTPYDIRYPTFATANAALQPAGVTYAVATGSAGNMFSAGRAGNYYYAVAGVSAAGESAPVVGAQQTLTAGQKVTLTISQASGQGESGYAIYRGRLNGTNATSDMRLIKRIPKAGATTIFVDENLDIPGTGKAYLLNMAPAADAIAWRQLLPMMEFALYPTATATIPWAQLLFGYLRLAKRKQHAVIKNILPSGAVWKPFG